MEAPLTGLRVLDFGIAAVGPVSAEYLAMLGADVIKIEAPGGDIVRRGKGGPGAWPGSTFLGNNIGKRGIVLDLKQDADRETALDLVKTADIVLENFRSPAVLERLGLGWDRMSAVNPRLIYLQSSAFGPVGPMFGKPSNDPVSQAFGGVTSVTGQPGGLPEISRGTMTLDWNGAMVNLEAMLIALYVRNRTGTGMRINTSQFQSTLIASTTRLAEYLATGLASGRMGSARPNIVPDQAFATADQYITVSAVNNRLWQRLCAALDDAELAGDARFATPAARVEHRGVLIPLLADMFRMRPSAEWVHRLRNAGVPVGEFQQTATIAESLLSNPQVQAEHMAALLQQTGGGDILSAQPHWRFDKTAARITRPSPALGEHQDEVLEELRTWQPTSPPEPMSGGEGLALARLRVVDLSQGVPGPLCAMQLGDLGADVIKIEPPDGDWLRQTPPFQSGEGALFLQLNRNKRGVAVDLKTATGLEFAKRLIATADVVVEGYRPGVMQRLGLDYESVSASNPRLIYCSISGNGSSGPLAQAPATELDVQATVGANRHLGRPGDPPQRFGYDQGSVAAGMAGVQGILASLLWRDRTGEGQHVETSLLAAYVAVLQCAFAAERSDFDLAYRSRGLPAAPNYGWPTADGRALMGIREYDKGWVPLIKAFGLDALLVDPRFASEATLNAHLPELREQLEPKLGEMRWDDARQIVEDQIGADFARMQDLAEVAEGPQVDALGMLPTLAGHARVGGFRTIGLPWAFDTERASLRMPPPLLGEHTRAVAQELGYSDLELDHMAGDTAILSVR